MSDTSDGNLELKPVVVSPSSPTPVKSTAVVKYSAVVPATFAQLQCNTNLNHPPSNWLSSSAESYGLQSVQPPNAGFSSFRMAHMFPDCVGEVDVVSDAENIKKLLKMPYSHGVVSMMVHRIENTLLLDDFDIQKYLLRQAENDWKWLKEFIYQHVFHSAEDKEKRLSHKPNSRNAIQQKNLTSKFLYHSLVPNVPHPKPSEQPPLPLQKLETEPPLPEPTNEEKPGPRNHFSRNIVWTFENIQMLIGTNMPIFGGQTHPCISLRLRDMNKPINVLTGIDYWLDNLMCNVPEVIMCYHLDGIVQKYELIKTEDLPNLDDAKFSPKVIRDVAQNILSFLKNNATKAGHTYWLFKGKDDDVVKLYDLTSLCSDISDDKGQNPFTVPVAMLLYRVARNMKYSSDGHQGTIRMLLKNCIDLLNIEKYPQIVTSAHYMLSDLYVPADTDPAAPVLVDQGTDDDDDDEDQNEESVPVMEEDNVEEGAISIQSLTLAHMRDEEENGCKFRPPAISGTVAERCLDGLKHVAEGLECLKYFPEEVKEEVKEEKEDVLKMAKPFEAIPMPYESLKNSKNEREVRDGSPGLRKKKKKKGKEKNDDKVKDSKALCKKMENLPTWQAPKSDIHDWKNHLRILLYEKATLIFAVLGEYEYTNQRFGRSLRYSLAVLRCHKILEWFCGMKNDKLISYLLGRTGDCCLMIVHDWQNIETHRNAYEEADEVELKILSEFFEISGNMNEDELLPDTLTTLESTLVISLKCYEKALALGPLESDRNILIRRLGNVHNELGVLYMNQATSKYQQIDQDESAAVVEVIGLLTKSHKHLEAGVEAFEISRDDVNLALLHSNTGRLMRTWAHIPDKKQSQEKYFYNKAITSYQTALLVLGSKKTNPFIWEDVTWELSSTLYAMATLTQDFTNSNYKTEEEVTREVVEILQKALKHCDTETPGSRQPIYQFRAANIEHRLGSLYHRIYRELDHDNETTKRKTSLQLSRMHYERAAKLFMTLEQPVEFLTVQLERVALAEHQASTSPFSKKLKAYQSGLEIILQCPPMLEVMIEKYKDNKVKYKNDDESKENNFENKNKENNMDNDENINNENLQNKIQDKKMNHDNKKIINNIRENQQDNEENQQNEKEENLIILLEQRLQYLLKSLTKLCLEKNSNKREYENLSNTYKMCYGKTLRPVSKSGIDLLEHLIKVLSEIAPKLRQIQDN
ncbi:erythroid differentiation-related factor 1 [Microplitis demolitor]|uniref:erythroid differentiation-related factor 1 n=1 Tax=Microplitis demolitor TaxID=69319 RepID=UPI00235B6F6E|nr:erythroid differentiation-related factor 1 [Microplitis demolitor]